MAELIVTTREGEERRIAAVVGSSVLDALRNGGIDEILALCGGCCSCATCHVHIDPEFFAKLPPVSADESDLLEGSLDRNETSRLSCQVMMTADLDGMRLTVAKED